MTVRGIGSAAARSRSDAAHGRGFGAQAVYEELRRSIIDLALPPGSPLDEVSLSRRFAVSRTPVREAVLRLVAEGLVRTLPNRNMVVAPVDIGQLPAYFEALSLMYRVTTRAAAVYAKAAPLDRIRALEAAYADAVARRDALDTIESNRDFHLAIAEAAGNVYFTGLFGRLLDEGTRLLRLYGPSVDDRQRLQHVEAHRQIVAAIASRDAGLADRLASEHAGQMADQIRSYVAGHPGSPGPAPSRSPPAAERRGYGVQTVYDTLRRDILVMALAPGEPLDETRLSRRFAMSRTPVREALVRLAAEGLVMTLPNRNTIVSPIDLSTLPTYFDALTLLYRVTTRLAAARRTEEDLATVRQIQEAFARSVRDADAMAMVDVNRDFHVAIAEAGGNPYFTQVFARVLDEGRRLLRLYYSTFDDRLPQAFVDEHDAIIAAIERRDAALADRLASAHALGIVRQIQAFLATGVAADIALTVPATGDLTV